MVILFPRLDGELRLQEVDDTKASIISGEEVVEKSENRVGVEDSQTSAKNGKTVTKSGAILGTLEERLEILQQATSDYQRAGGKIALAYKEDANALVIVLVMVKRCSKCGFWLFGDKDCQNCAKDVAPALVA